MSVILKPSKGKHDRPQAGKDYIMEIEMKYSQYKNEWFKCKTVKGSYNGETKTIVVNVPEVCWKLHEIIPVEDVEAFRKTLIETGAPEYADTLRIMEIYADDIRHMTADEMAACDVDWAKKAIEVVLDCYGPQQCYLSR